jgi:threonine dehydrogenase-like Zn-dependent dehydrogenase
VRLEQRDDPKITEPTDAIIRMTATCVCGSDLWDYRGINPVTQPTPMGHEYCGIVEEVGSDVHSIKPGQFVIGSFFASDNTCPHCQAGFQSSCQHREPTKWPRPSGSASRWPVAPWCHPRPTRRRPHPQPADPVGRDGDRLVCCRRGEGAAWYDRRGGR